MQFQWKPAANRVIIFFFRSFSRFRGSTRSIAFGARTQPRSRKQISDERQPEKGTEKYELVSLVSFGAKLAADSTMETRDCRANTNEIEYEQKKRAWMIVMRLRLVSR